MPAARAAFLDQLKVGLIGLVIVHHLSISFGASGSWYYRDPTAPDSLALSVFTAINQAFFMGLFFFISGYFTPASVNRKGPLRFLADRAVRLLVPIAVFGVAIAPGLEYVKRTSLGLATPSLVAYYPRRIADLCQFDPGPLWFLWALLLFNAGYALWCVARPGAAAPFGTGAAAQAPRRITAATLTAVAGAITAVTLVVRLRWPIGQNVSHLQIAYLPQYVVMFGLGVAAGRRRSLDELSAHLLPRAAIAAVLGVALAACAYGGADGDTSRIAGHAHWQAIMWAAGEALLCVGLSAGLLVGFNQRARPPGPLGRELAAGAFATYVLHAPVVVVVALAVHWLDAPPLIALAISVLVAVPCSFLLGIAVHRAPGVGRII